jgi:hypothetical protein
MKTLKFSSYVVLLMIGLSTILSSCKKDKDYPIDGIWEGTYKIVDTDSFVAFNIYKDGTLDVRDNPNQKTQITATGTWKIEFGQFDATLDYGSGPVTTFTASYNKSSPTMTGTWNSIPPGVANTWTMTKQ